jgi:hypothetical protein
MKAKVFDVLLHRLPPDNKSPAGDLEEQLNKFLTQHPGVQLVATHMNTVVLPAEPHAAPRSEAAESSLAIFSTLFYTE